MIIFFKASVKGFIFGSYEIKEIIVCRDLVSEIDNNILFTFCSELTIRASIHPFPGNTYGSCISLYKIFKLLSNISWKKKLNIIRLRHMLSVFCKYVSNYLRLKWLKIANKKCHHPHVTRLCTYILDTYFKGLRAGSCAIEY